MKILDILPYIPYPLNSGGNQAVFNMLEEMVKEHDVHLLLRYRTNKDAAAAEQLKERLPQLTIHACDERQDILNVNLSGTDKSGYTWSMRLFDYFRKSMERKINRRRNKIIAKKIRNNRNEGGIKAPVVPSELARASTTLYNFFPENTERYLDFIYETSRKGFDVIQCEFYETVTFACLLPKDVKKVFVHHELRYIRNYNEMSLFEEITPKDVYTYNTLKGEELSSLEQFDCVVTLTETDKQLLLKECPNLHVYVSPAVVQYSSCPLAFQPLNKELVFVGHGLHYPNLDGVLWYCGRVAPILRERGNEPLLYITGEWSDDMRFLIKKTKANVRFAGFVEDLHTFLNGKLTVVPIRIGSGMRMKILDAIDSCSPIVSTTKGCEGLDFEHERDIYICDEPQAFADAIETVLGSEEKQREMCLHSKDVLKNTLQPEEQKRLRLNLYTTCLKPQ